MPITRVPSVSIPSPSVLGSPADRGAQWRWREVDLDVQTTRTLIEPRLELPGLPGRVLELNGNNKFSLTCQTTIIGKDLLESSTACRVGVLYLQGIT